MHELRDGAAPDELRRELQHEREQLVDALEALRHSTHVADAVALTLRRRLPVAIALAFVAGFVLNGGVGASMRLVFRRRRERQRPLLRIGRIAVVER